MQHDTNDSATLLYLMCATVCYVKLAEDLWVPDVHCNVTRPLNDSALKHNMLLRDDIALGMAFVHCYIAGYNVA